MVVLVENSNRGAIPWGTERRGNICTIIILNCKDQSSSHSSLIIPCYWVRDLWSRKCDHALKKNVNRLHVLEIDNITAHFNVSKLDLLESEVLGSSEPLDPLQRRREPVWALGIRNAEHLLQSRPECPPLQTQPHVCYTRTKVIFISNDWRKKMNTKNNKK